MPSLPNSPWTDIQDFRVAVDAPVSTDLWTDTVVNLNYLYSAVTLLSGQNVVPFTTSGSWLCPAGITKVLVRLWGGGGGGGGANGNNGFAGLDSWFGVNTQRARGGQPGLGSGAPSAPYSSIFGAGFFQGGNNQGGFSAFDGLFWRGGRGGLPVEGFGDGNAPAPIANTPGAAGAANTGAGGGGGGDGVQGGGGGNSGEYSEYFLTVVPGTNYTVTVGAGGSGSVGSGNNGGTGGSGYVQVIY